MLTVAFTLLHLTTQVFLTRRLQVGKEMQCHPECFRIYALNYKEYIYTSGNLTHVYPYMMSPEFPDTRTIGKYCCDFPRVLYCACTCPLSGKYQHKIQDSFMTIASIFDTYHFLVCTYLQGSVLVTARCVTFTPVGTPTRGNPSALPRPSCLRPAPTPCSP